MKLLEQLKNRASESNKTIILPETADRRILDAAHSISTTMDLSLILIGEKEKILKINPGLNRQNVKIQNWKKENSQQTFISFIRQKNKKKNLSDREAESMLQDPLVYAGALIAMNQADGAVAGSVATTASVIRAGIRTVGVHPGSELVSSVFLMVLKDGRVISYSDCGVVPYPDSKQLSSIAIDAGYTHYKLTGSDPRIAFLSFSTKGSAVHEKVDLVRDAAERAAFSKKDWVIDGELQFDAAFIPDIANSKAPDSPLKGSANVFIFPNLDAGNIAYKITERLAGAAATGPILQGLSKPYLDLSRGCSVDDIVHSICVAAILAS